MSIGDNWRRVAPIASLCVLLAWGALGTTASASESGRCSVFAAAPYDIIVEPDVAGDVTSSVSVAPADSPVARILGNPGYDWSLLAQRLGAYAPAAATIAGIASTYNPFEWDDKDAGAKRTASGEFYDPDDWTAAIQTDLRWIFKGVRYGRTYRPAFALVEIGDKRAVIRINDVGPLAPGRIIDLNERVMRYFDPSMTNGVLDAKVTPLLGTNFVAGPIEPHAVTMAGDLLLIR